MARYLKIDKAIYWVDESQKPTASTDGIPTGSPSTPMKASVTKNSRKAMPEILKTGRTKVFRFNEALPRRVEERRLTKK